MKFICLTINNKEVIFESPNFVTIDIDKQAPADSMTVTFECNERVDEIKEIKAYIEDDLIFNGIIDEQQFIIMNSGIFLKLYIRSKAGLLLDNEALPQIYNFATLNTIFERHIKPYGFIGIEGNKDTMIEKLSVTKGMSEWDVLNNFCAVVLGITPRVTVDGYIDLTDPELDDILYINEKNSKICNYLAKEKIKRCDQISQSYVRVHKGGAYDGLVSNEEAISKGIVRKRYVNIVDNNKMTMQYVENQVEKSNKDSYELNLTLNGYIKVRLGTRVEIDNKVLGNVKNLIVDKIRYTLNPESDFTELTLRRM